MSRIDVDDLVATFKGQAIGQEAMDLVLLQVRRAPRAAAKSPIICAPTLLTSGLCPLIPHRNSWRRHCVRVLVTLLALLEHLRLLSRRPYTTSMQHNNNIRMAAHYHHHLHRATPTAQRWTLLRRFTQMVVQ
jgi:hypothetical protein